MGYDELFVNIFKIAFQNESQHCIKQGWIVCSSIIMPLVGKSTQCDLLSPLVKLEMSFEILNMSGTDLMVIVFYEKCSKGNTSIYMTL